MTTKNDPLAAGFRILDDGSIEVFTERETRVLVARAIAEAAKILRPPTRGAAGAEGAA